MLVGGLSFPWEEYMHNVNVTTWIILFKKYIYLNYLSLLLLIFEIIIIFIIIIVVVN